jgi:hypothetical protein
VIVVAVAASALAGCNANQAINPSGQADLSNIYPDYNSYNPDSYAPNHTGWVARLQVHVSGALSELGFRHADNFAELRTDATPTMWPAAGFVDGQLS